MKLKLYIQTKHIENELDELYLEYEINGEAGRKGIKFNRFQQDKSFTDELAKVKSFPVDPFGLSLEDFYKPSELLFVGEYIIDSKDDIKDTIIKAKDNLKHTNPEVFI